MKDKHTAANIQNENHNRQNQDTRSADFKRETKVDANGRVVEVLYQRMGDRWFAFSLIDDEVFVGSLTPEEITGVKRSPKLSGNS